MEGEITYQELSTALKNMKNSKSPGSDRFTAEFFEFFCKDIGIFILISINYSYKKDRLSVTNKNKEPSKTK